LRFVSEDERVRAVIDEHLEWIASHGSLRAAVRSHERDFAGSPIQAWLDERAHLATIRPRRRKARRRK
jgi:hypothetical protein